jgi:hypothetical protein
MHGPGSERNRRAQAWASGCHAAWILRKRAFARRMATPSRRRTAQVERFVYRKYYGGRDLSGVACYTYTPHRVMRESARFFWVNTEEVAIEEYTSPHPEELRTFRLDRHALEAGDAVRHYGRGWADDWVLTLPATAIEEDRRWVDYAEAAAAGPTPPCLDALGLTLPCTVQAITRAYRQRARILHPDTGGDHEAFLVLQQHYAAALQLVAS